MNTNDTDTPISNPAWLALGELILAFGDDIRKAIRQSLPKILEPLQLSENFFDRLIQSAWESARRAFEVQDENPPGHIHLSFFVPTDTQFAGKTWGFFSIAKLEKRGDGQGAGLHTIHYYLYVEGE